MPPALLVITLGALATLALPRGGVDRGPQTVTAITAANYKGAVDSDGFVEPAESEAELPGAGSTESTEPVPVDRSAIVEAAQAVPVTTIPYPCLEFSFRDDFDGDSLGPEWEVYSSLGAHSPHAVRRPEAVAIADGKLVITARNDESGRAMSGGLRLGMSQTYGRFAFRVRTDEDLANVTSGVVLTWPVSGSQPLDGENNIYETLRAPGDREPFYTFIHEPFDEKADGISQTRFTHRGDATQWQEMAMEWTPRYIEISWTNPETGSTKTIRLTESTEDLVTDAEHFLAIQLDLFKGAFPDDRQIQMEVDWVEVHTYCS